MKILVRHELKSRPLCDSQGPDSFVGRVCPGFQHIELVQTTPGIKTLPDSGGNIKEAVSPVINTLILGNSGETTDDGKNGIFVGYGYRVPVGMSAARKAYPDSVFPDLFWRVVYPGGP